MSTSTTRPVNSVAHPPYKDMVIAAINALNERNGSSRQAIAKYIRSNFKVIDEKVRNALKLALKRGVAKGELIQVKGSGASGSFKVEKPKPAKKPAEKKPAAKKPKSKPSKAKPKKPASKGKPKKATKPSPKKTGAVKKTGATKKASAKKTKTPKKPAAKKAAKKTTKKATPKKK